MDALSPIPVFTLYGETLPFPDVVHCERILDRAGQHGWHIAPHRHSQMAQIFTIEDGQARVTLDGVDSWLNACRSTLIKEKLPLLAYFGDFCASI